MSACLGSARRGRTLAAALCLVAGVSAGLLPAAAAGAPSSVTGATATRATADPAHDTSPSSKFADACRYRKATTAAIAACTSAAIADFDRVRASERLGPITFPSGFNGMSVPVQLLVLSNLERVDRGLVPVKALSPQLDAEAQKGARDRTDPPFENPFPGDLGGSNWASEGPGAPLDDFEWMYDDGYGSGNSECSSPKAAACWGHRHDILGVFGSRRYSKPLLMGAASAHGGWSMTEEFVSADRRDSTRTPKWSSITKTISLGVSRTSVTVHAQSTARTAGIGVWASGVEMPVKAVITSGGPQWSVTPASLSLAAGTEKTVTVRYDPAGSPESGVLRLRTPNSVRKVHLHP